MRVRYLPRDLLRRGVRARDTAARYFLITEYFLGNKGNSARERIIEKNVN